MALTFDAISMVDSRVYEQLPAVQSTELCAIWSYVAADGNKLAEEGRLRCGAVKDPECGELKSGCSSREMELQLLMMKLLYENE
jgi:hypothetical protein